MISTRCSYGCASNSARRRHMLGTHGIDHVVMRRSSIAPLLLCAPRMLTRCAEVDALCRQIQRDPAGNDLIIDFSGVETINPSAAQQITDNVFWRIHWSRVGCVIDAGPVLEALAARHIDRAAWCGSTLAAVLFALDIDRRVPPGGWRPLGPLLAAS